MIKIALAQMEVIPGEARKNVDRMLRFIKEAKEKGANIVAFPEMCVGGYLLGDKWLSDCFCLGLMSYNKELAEASKGIVLVYGNVYLDSNEEIETRVKEKGYHPNKDGRSRKYNAIYVFDNGKACKRSNENNIFPEGVQAKSLLPNYRIFDDERYFFSLEDVAKDFGVKIEDLASPFTTEIGGKKITLGVELCEDLWCEDYRREKKALNITKMLIDNGAEIIVNLSSSPWTYGKNNSRDRRVLFLKKESGKNFVPFFYVNCTGVQNNGKNIVTFDGGSTVYNREGQPIVFSKSAYEEELMVIDEKELENKALERLEKGKIAQKYEAIIRGIKSIKDMAGMKEQTRIVIGMSGGIDSAVVSALLVLALGKEKVIGVNLPTKYNSKKTINAAEYVAKKLGIKYGVVPIGEIVELNTKMINEADLDGSGKKVDIVNLENIQAKIRGTTILSNLAAKYSAMFTNNGNKDEVFLGYATLYGDVGGAFAPIADLTKIEVVELAKYLNKEIFRDEVIPKTLIPDELWRFASEQIQPSAELKDNQVDPMKFVYHCALVDAMTDYKKKSSEDIMQWFLEGRLHEYIDQYLTGLNGNKKIGYELMKRWGVDKAKNFVEDLEWFESQMQRNVFKRVQSPPIIITSKSSFGFDIRESIIPFTKTEKYEELKEKVLALEKYEPRRME